MDEVEKLKKIAASLLDKAEKSDGAASAAALEHATALLRLVSDVEKSQAELGKLSAEAEKLRYDLANASRRDRSEIRKSYLGLMTPLVTTVVLAATLILQTCQFVQSEKNKREAAEDAQWSETVKSLSQSNGLSPSVVLLNPFLKSTRYHEAGQAMALQLLIKTNDQLVFRDVFRAAFVPVRWTNLAQVLELNRTIKGIAGPLFVKSYDPVTITNDMTKLNPSEQAEVLYARVVLQAIGEYVAPLFKAKRPAGMALDLSATHFMDSDWSGVNLSDADLNNCYFVRVNFNGADLDHIKDFTNVSFDQTAWWEAHVISPELLAYLLVRNPYNPQTVYGVNRSGRQVPTQEFAAAVERLRKMSASN